MAEEKKFADEVISDEELDGVAGGSVHSIAADSEFLYEHGLVDDWHGELTTLFIGNHTVRQLMQVGQKPESLA